MQLLIEFLLGALFGALCMAFIAGAKEAYRMAREKHVVCGVFGTIYLAPINKDHKMGDPRYEITSEAVKAVAQHMETLKRYDEEGWSAYEFKGQEGLMLVAFDNRKWRLTPVTDDSEGKHD